MVEVAQFVLVSFIEFTLCQLLLSVCRPLLKFYPYKIGNDNYTNLCFKNFVAIST